MNWIAINSIMRLGVVYCFLRSNKYIFLLASKMMLPMVLGFYNPVKVCVFAHAQYS